MNKALAHDRAEIHLKMFRSIDTEYRELHWRTLSPNTQLIPVCILDPDYSALLASTPLHCGAFDDDLGPQVFLKFKHVDYFSLPSFVSRSSRTALLARDCYLICH